jgi:hypothetical protein
LDPENPVVKLCLEGMRLEGEGKPEAARDCFARAWEAAADAFDACIAAHYLARHQPTPQEMLRWNQVALDRAAAVGDERVAGFYPSLYLNLGYSYEQAGDREAARRFYTLAADHLPALPEGRYREIVQEGITAGLTRLNAPGQE